LQGQREEERRLSRQLSPAYVTLALALVAAMAGWGIAVVPTEQRVATVGLGSALMLLILCDLDRYRLPDLLTLPLIAAGLLATLGLPGRDLIGHVIGAAIGFALLAALAWGHWRLRGIEGIGGGDAKLVAAGGAWLGWQALPAMLLIAAIGGLAWVAIAAWRRRTPVRVPFGVPLSATIWLLWLYGVPGYAR
jgi:leader peptidase (prepilin peptidase)/N-methyltransferase